MQALLGRNVRLGRHRSGGCDLSAIDINGLDYWFPKIEGAGLPVPRTTIIRAEGDLSPLLEGRKPEHWDVFLALMQAACYDHGVPCFLRTSHGSGKHEWLSTCYVENAEHLGWNISRLVEWSHIADFMGLPHEVWAVRDLIPNASPFVLTRYGNMPWNPEWRFFVRDGEIEHVQRYWPEDALEQGHPDRGDWRKISNFICETFEQDEEFYEAARLIARKACNAVGGGYWSVDLLLSSITESLWLTDMADGDRSYRYER